MSYDYIIGAGHTPSGTEGCGASGVLNESNCTREIAPLIVSALNSNGKTAKYSVFNNGNSYNLEDCHTRINEANADNCGMYVEIHLNSSPGATGVEVLIPPNNSNESVSSTATALCAGIAEAFGYTNRGVKQERQLTIFSNAKVPVLLIECGFVDSPDSDKYDANKYANAIASVLAGVTINNGGAGNTDPGTAEPLWKDGWNQDVMGWFYVTNPSTKTYYKSSDGWQKIKEAFYIFNDSGYAYQNEWYEDSTGIWYFLDNDCKMIVSTWLLVSNTDIWYYINESGQMLVNKWVLYKDKWYYLKETGEMAATDWVKDNDKWYYLNDNGEMAVKQWVDHNNNTYYFDENGVMVASKTIEIDGKTYKFDNNGVSSLES